MFISRLFYSLLLVLFSSLYAEAFSRSYRLGLRHIEGKGIGYQKGYTTLEGFFLLPGCAVKQWVPFADLRGHVFNNGKLAANAGLGVRYLTSSWVWGANGYYDYRQTSHKHYSQASLGLEALGRWWDFRLNGYWPVGETKSPLYAPCFSHFTGNCIMISKKQEHALRGANLEAGYHFKRWHLTDFYAALGPYYFRNPGKNAVGGKGRIKALIADLLGVEVSGSYDKLFGTIVQAELSVNLPLGCQQKLVSKKAFTSAQQTSLHRRAVATVDRFEIIVLNKTRECMVACNPCTQAPYRLVFVNNRSVQSQGSFEEPYTRLLCAEFASPKPDLIYVYPGNGSDQGMNIGIMLAENQNLWSSSHSHLLPTLDGPIYLPSSTKMMPRISTRGILGGGDFVVELSGNNAVSGFILDGRALDQAGLLRVVDGENVVKRSDSDPFVSLSNNRIFVPKNGTGLFLQDLDRLDR